MDRANSAATSVLSDVSQTFQRFNTSSVSSRKFTPIRPVYEDFRTTHLYITAGPTKSKQHLKETYFGTKADGPLPPTPALLANLSTSALDLSQITSETFTKHTIKPEHLKYSSPQSSINEHPLKDEHSLRSTRWKNILNRLSYSSMDRREPFFIAPLRPKQRDPFFQAACEANNPSGGCGTELRAVSSEKDVCGETQSTATADANDNPAIALSERARRLAPSRSCHGDDILADQPTPHTHIPSELSNDRATMDSHYNSSILESTGSEQPFSRQGESTVSNIVKHYENDNNDRGDSLKTSQEEGSDMNRQSNNTLLVTSDFWSSIEDAIPRSNPEAIDPVVRCPSPYSRRQYKVLEINASMGTPPLSSLPELPTTRINKPLNNTHDGVVQSSSYGDTRNLLDLTQRTQTIYPVVGTATAQYELFAPVVPRDTPKARNSDESLEKGIVQSSESSLESSKKSCLQSAKRQATALQVFVGVHQENSIGVQRVALERDVSLALRREYSCSDFSDDITGMYEGNGGFQSSSDSGTLLKLLSVHDSIFAGSQVSREHFYEDSLSPQKWQKHRFNGIRIPIKGPESISSYTESPASSSVSNPFELEVPQGHNDEVNEWETVGESGIASHTVTNMFNTMEVNVESVGSSLADTSDGGTLQMTRGGSVHFKDYMLRHPANVQYSHAYCQREVKRAAVPVLLPAHRDFAVNGFPINTSRSHFGVSEQTSLDVGHHTASPLSVNHVNPFKSSPPDVMRVSSKPSQSSKGTDVSLSEKSITRLEYEPLTYGATVRNSPSTSDTNHSGTQERNPAAGVGLPSTGSGGKRTVGSSIADASTSSLDLDSVSEGRCQQGFSTADINMPRVTVHLTSDTTVPQPPAIFSRRPPGALYQSLRAMPNRSDHHHHPPTSDTTTSTPRQGATQYTHGTNKMRPLSLLANHREREMTNESQSGEFCYRSPLAPIKSQSWFTLYTREQLNDIYEASKVNASSELLSPLPTPSRGDTMRTEGSWRYLRGVPRMSPWPRDNSSLRMDTATRKRQFSTFCLFLCVMFPPALPLFGYGLLDGVLLWITDGEIAHFGRRHKQIARYMTGLFILAVIIGLIVGIYYSRQYA